MENHGRHGFDDAGRVVAWGADAFSFCGSDAGRADRVAESSGGGDDADS
jgi:hypothetical protein